MHTVLFEFFCHLLYLFIKPFKPTGKNGLLRIAVYRDCCIGDVIQTTPSIRHLRESFPDAIITYFVGGWSMPALAGNVNINEVVAIPPVKPSLPSIIRRMPFFLKQRGRKLDALICYNFGFYSALESWLMGAKIRVGLNDHSAKGSLYNVRVNFDRYLNRQKLYLQMAATITRRTTFDYAMDFFVTADLRRKAQGLIELDQSSPPYIALSPGGGSNPFVDLPQKRWAADRFAAVANLLHAKYGSSAILIGGKADMPIADRVGTALTGPFINLSGRTTLGETAALLEKCILLIGNDSAPIFFASAVSCPTIGIYGPELAGIAAPLGTRHTSIEKNLNCRPCFPHPTCNDCICIERISVDEVFNAACVVIDHTGTSPKRGDCP